MENFQFLDTGGLLDGEIYLRLKNLLVGNPAENEVPSYILRIMDIRTNEILGRISLRVGKAEKGSDLYYAGNVGYTVEERYRGNNYAYRACLLLFELAREHGMDELIITCNPDNIPSRRTCEKLGGELIEIADVPKSSEFYERGEYKKCIFHYKL